MRDEEEVERDAEQRHGDLHGGAQRLLAKHVQEELRRPHRRAEQEADDKDQHHRIAVDELRAEQPQQRDAQYQDDDGCGQ